MNQVRTRGVHFQLVVNEYHFFSRIRRRLAGPEKTFTSCSPGFRWRELRRNFLLGVVFSRKLLVSIMHSSMQNRVSRTRSLDERTAKSTFGIDPEQTHVLSRSTRVSFLIHHGTLRRNFLFRLADTPPPSIDLEPGTREK